MDSKAKWSQWSVDETHCLLSLWSSSEIQSKLEGATRTKVIFWQLQLEMAAAGYDRSADQIINKLKKLKKGYRDQKKDQKRSGCGRLPKIHFDILDSVLGDIPSSCQVTGALNSAIAMIEVKVEESLIESTPDIEFSPVDVDLNCTSPTSPCSSGTSNSTLGQAKQGKRKRDTSDTDLLQYLERSDERYLQYCRESQEETQRVNKEGEQILESILANNTAMLGLMERMVVVMEAQSKNKDCTTK